MENNFNSALEGLNEEQLKAVQCVEGPVLIVAGAGSGKTKVLTSRVAGIISSGVDPSRILSLTFTKKAATEMKERIALVVGSKQAGRVVMGTFHSVFVRFLREFAQSLGYPGQFTIYDTSDSQSAMKACIKELGLDDKIYKPRDILARISMAKNNLVTVSSYRSRPEIQASDQHSRKPRTGDLYELYQRKLKQAGVMDFDDILVNMNVLLRDNKDALASIADRFSYIMVDEYQDTNYAQYLILKKLSDLHRNICVVGDDSQSIYAFRGAKIENILNFKKDYPDCRTFRLERNYRSTRTIVGAANSVIERNEGRIPKQCYSEGEQGEKISVLKTYAEQEEAMMIVSGILSRMRTSSAQYQDFAVLYRTNSQSRAIEEQLRRRNIPYMIYSGNSFFERAEVKDMMAYFKLAVNPNDDESFKRVVNKPARAIGDTTVGALAAAALAMKTSLFRAAGSDCLESYGLKAAAIEKLRVFCRMIEGFRSSVSGTDAYELARRIADDSGLYAFYKADNSIEGMARTANIEELVSSVQSFIEERQEEVDEGEFDTMPTFTLDDYLENVSLLSNVDVTEDEDSSNKVALMTVHSAKGLEFPYVFIAGLEENLFPSLSMLSSQHDVEEERRLFYVALTRAKKAVTLSYALTRMRNGKHESNSASRFIREIDPVYLDSPLTDDEGSCPSSGGFRFGSGFGSGAGSRVSYSAGGGRSSYGASGPVKRIPASGNGYPSLGSSERPVAARHRSFGPAVPTPAEVADFQAVDPSTLREGQRVEHNRFGKGVIKTISGGADKKAVIVFDDYGEKLLLLKYAKLRPAE